MYHLRQVTNGLGWILVLCFLAVGSAAFAGEPPAVQAARGVLSRTFGARASAEIELSLLPPNKPGSPAEDRYTYQAEGGKLRVAGTSTAAICRGTYDYLRRHHLGTIGWAGARLRLPEKWPDTPLTETTSPFSIRHCHNVVTSGYTTPYWDWARWEQELDWMAMHGYNMIMAPVATEAIAIRVWKKMGLTDQEIKEYYTGPAHLPWHRMGNIRNVGEGLTESWHRDQIALQKKLLARMKELGIEPVIQGFAGFVPPGIQRIHPEVTLHPTHWNDGFPVSQRPVVMLPDSPLWAEIGKAFITEWKKEFGDARYWLVDSFNELQLPKTDQPPAVMLAQYGRATYDTIRAADPDAIWVLQGWMFYYQRNIWNKETVKALLDAVPHDKLLILDYANEYSDFKKRNQNWLDFDGYHGHSWVMGYVPNMGGKTAYTGKMDFYASQVAKTLASPAKGNLTGFTICGEGFDNNEVLYELMSDTAWSRDAIDPTPWLTAYAANRYGSDDPELAGAWHDLRSSVYSSFSPHPMFGWQIMQLGHGSVYRDPKFPKAVQRFLSVAGKFGDQPNYRDDAVEMAALALGLRAEDWFALARSAHSAGEAALFQKAVDSACALLTQADTLLESHSYLRLAHWLDFTRRHGGSDADKLAWESNAKQIITTWGPPVNDYACRVWSGLIRDFYIPRMKAVTEAMAAGQPFDRGTWEAAWLKSPGISPVQPLDDPATQASEWVNAAYQSAIPKIGSQVGEVVGTWEPGKIKTDWSVVEWPLGAAWLEKLGGVRFQFTGGDHRLDIREVSIVADGQVVASDKHDGTAGNVHRGHVYRFDIPAETRANNTLILRADIRSMGGANSRGNIILVPKSE